MTAYSLMRIVMHTVICSNIQNYTVINNCFYKYNCISMKALGQKLILFSAALVSVLIYKCSVNVLNKLMPKNLKTYF